MALTGAQRQARLRAKQKAELERLRKLEAELVKAGKLKRRSHRKAHLGS